MAQVAQRQNIWLQWFFWNFIEMPRNIIRIWKGYFRFSLEYFSTPLLIKTFFAPWRRYELPHGKGFDIGQYVYIAVSNLISRTIGAFIRFFLILIGLFVEVSVFFLGAVVLVLWLILPILLLIALYFSLKLLFL
jgi:hypothetical protein